MTSIIVSHLAWKKKLLKCHSLKNRLPIWLTYGVIMSSYKVAKRYFFTYILVWSYLNAYNMSSATKTSKWRITMKLFKWLYAPKWTRYMCTGHFFPDTVVIIMQETETKYLQIERLFVDFRPSNGQCRTAIRKSSYRPLNCIASANTEKD